MRPLYEIAAICLPSVALVEKVQKETTCSTYFNFVSTTQHVHEVLFGSIFFESVTTGSTISRRTSEDDDGRSHPTDASRALAKSRRLGHRRIMINMVHEFANEHSKQMQVIDECF